MSKQLDQLVVEGKSLFKKGNVNRALTKFQEAQKLNPNIATINKNIRNIQTKLRSKADRLRPFQKYAAATPGMIKDFETKVRNLTSELEAVKGKLNNCKRYYKDCKLDREETDIEHAECFQQLETIKKEVAKLTELNELHRSGRLNDSSGGSHHRRRSKRRSKRRSQARRSQARRSRRRSQPRRSRRRSHRRRV